MIRLTNEVAQALRGHHPVVALESSVFAHGLPSPANREAARRMTAAIAAGGAIAAVTAVVRGVAAAGLDEREFDRLFDGNDVRKLSARDVPFALAQGADGATTVAAAAMIAHRAGIEVLVTGGIGGVHRRPAYDESADLVELSRTPVLVVCAGAKAVLDMGATNERLESLGVPVIGYRTNEMPGFYARGTGIGLAARAESALDVAAAWRMHRDLGRTAAMVVMQPIAERYALSRASVERAVQTALRAASRRGARGAAATPALLAEVDRATKGKARAANVALLESNAALGAEIAAKLSGMAMP